MKYILTDIDDTILRFADAFQDWAETKGYIGTDRLRDTCSIEKLLGSTDREIVNNFIDEFSCDPKFMANLEPEPDALVILPVLHKMGYEIVAISSCSDKPGVQESREANLKKVFGFDFAAVHCVGLQQPKSAVLKNYPSSIWVEDNFKHALDGASIGHKSYLMEREYNRDKGLRFATGRMVPNWYHIHHDIVQQGFLLDYASA
jgi:5'(3')-deoxyribonucleotidase